MPWQEKRTVAVATPLGDDVLLFRRMVATEQLSRPFVFDLELLSENHGIASESILGQPVTIRFDLPSGADRHFNGLASQFAYQGTLGRHASYRCRLSPWLWFLTRTSNCRIFQNKSVPEIIKAVFQDRGFTDFDESKLTGAYRQWIYCVQYRETDFNFVSRLMEEEGISYFFRHEDGKHTLMLADDNANLDTLPDYETIPFYPPEDAQFRERDHISRWTVGHEVQPGASVLRDFDFEKPSANLETRLTKPHEHALARFEVYDYPGIYTNKADGDVLSRLRLEQSHVGYERAQGSGDVAGLSPGCLFTLTNHPRPDQNRDYVVEATTLEIVSEAYESGGTANAGGLSCSCTLTAMDRACPCRPPRVTAKPTVRGPQTAIVTGPAGEEIWTDKYGRVKVQFHWDREGQRDENSSCWVRVSHPWAGKSWGAVAIPRIGQEVIVDFLEGDPDQPIITGRVYNAETMPPFGLPASAVISGLKSNSTKGGGGYNEYVMDDTKGNELIREHGQYDKDSTIEHDLREHVLNSRFRDVTVDETIDIGHDQTYTIVNNQTGTVGVNKTLTVGANHTESIGSNMTITVASMLTETVGINYAETVGAAMELTVGALMTETVGAAKIQTIGASKVETIGGSKSVNVAKSQSVKIGTDKSEEVGGGKSVSVGKEIKIASLGATIHVTAAEEIVLTAGQSQLILKKDGKIVLIGTEIALLGSDIVTASANTVSCTGNEEARMAVSSQVVSCTTEKVETSGSSITSSAVGVQEITGALIKIN